MIQTPTIITVFDSKMHKVTETVVDYSEYEALVNAIKPSCEKKQYTVRTTVAPSLQFFKSKLE